VATLSSTSKPRLIIADAEIDSFSFSEVVDLILDKVNKRGAPAYIVTPNAQHVVLLNQEARLRAVYLDAFLSVPDGVPLLWASRLLGKRLPGRVNGTDLLEHLCSVAEQKMLKVFFLGGRPGAADAAAQAMQSRFPQLRPIVTFCPPYGFENDTSRVEEVRDLIRTAKPDLLFVGFGAPKQEYWMHDNRDLLGVPVSVGIGGSFELLAGFLPRAPKLMQRVGCEWLFRLAIEPGRLWKRYLLMNSAFVWLVIKQVVRNRRVKVAPQA
jgi:N-acetylglucosaminyldiphosphoundecaprenol N-acetyl-beta-D-mannosaminyltransferase